MADFKDAAPWDTRSIVGIRRFLDKVHNLFVEWSGKQAADDNEAMKTIHKAIKKIGEDIENYKFNTAIAQLMICMNMGEPKDTRKNKEWRGIFVKLLHPFAPHMAEELWEKLFQEPERYTEVYFATQNEAKISRVQKMFEQIDTSIKVLAHPDRTEVEETWKTPLECAIQKLEPYKTQQRTLPIISADTAVYFEDQDFDPTRVRRAAIEASGKKEADMTRKEIAEEMVAFYKKKAQEAWGEVDFYYIDSFAVLFPDGNIKTYEYRREYTLTDTHEWDIYEFVPMRGLYISKVTWKRAGETTPEDYLKELECTKEALEDLFSYNKASVFFTEWPVYDEDLVVDNEVTIWVQVLGKLRGEIQIAVDEDKESVLEKAKNNENVMKWLEGKELIKEIYVPWKIVNLVVK